jgi:hypothetical protein
VIVGAGVLVGGDVAPGTEFVGSDGDPPGPDGGDVAKANTSPGEKVPPSYSRLRKVATDPFVACSKRTSLLSTTCCCMLRRPLLTRLLLLAGVAPVVTTRPVISTSSSEAFAATLNSGPSTTTDGLEKFPNVILSISTSSIPSNLEMVI